MARIYRLLVALPLILFATAASAHIDPNPGGFISGFSHPIRGWDHVVAMVAVGLWGAFLGMPAIWLLPVVFPVVMAFGGALGVIGMPLPGTEVMIGLSGLVLGLMIAFAVRAPIWLAAVVVGTFAIFHGHAHGVELPDAVNPLAYGIGFVVATGMLHLSGIGLGFLAWTGPGRIVVRLLGLGIAAVGAGFLFGVF